MPPRIAKSSLEHQAPHATRRTEGTIPVRATKPGFYDNHIKKLDEEFSIESMEQFSESWMKLVGGTALERAEMVAAWRMSKVEKMPTKTDDQRAAKLEAERRAEVAEEADRQAAEDDDQPTENSENDESKPVKKGAKSKSKAGKPDKDEKSENDVL